MKKNIEGQLIREINRNMLLQEQARAYQEKLLHDPSLHTPDPSEYEFCEDEFSASEEKKFHKRKKKKKNLKNETKNISKNFGKAIITFVE